MQIGLDIFEKHWPKKLGGSRVGLLVHPASVNRKLEHAVELLNRDGAFHMSRIGLVRFNPDNQFFYFAREVPEVRGKDFCSISVG